MTRPLLSVLIITYNEEIHLEHCLRSLAGWVDEIFVVDSFSTDRTVEIARSFGAHVVQHEFQYHAQQKNWALSNLPIRGEWILLLDADEWVPSNLRDEIVSAVRNDDNRYDGYWIKRRVLFYGKWIRHCGWYPVWILRLVRRSVASIEDRRLDEHAVVPGAVGYLKNDLIHEDLRDMHAWIAKHNCYSSRSAAMFLGHETSGVEPKLFGNQAQRKRFIKEKIWRHLPARGLLYFFYLYIVRLGFLDGRHGLLFCTMRGIFEHFNTVKLWELEHFKEGAPAGSIALPAKVRTDQV